MTVTEACTAYSPCNVQSRESISSLTGLDENPFPSLGMEIFITNPVQDNSGPPPTSAPRPHRLLPTLPSAPPTCLGRKGRGTGSRITLHFWHSASSVTQRHSRRSSLPARGTVFKLFTSFSSLQATIPQTVF